jgi:hypothetical protein
VFSHRNKLLELVACKLLRIAATLFFAVVLLDAVSVLGGGSGLNTVIVANRASSNSCMLANYYCEQRSVPPENLLKINWTGGNISWSDSEFVTNLLNPLHSHPAELMRDD